MDKLIAPINEYVHIVSWWTLLSCVYLYWYTNGGLYIYANEDLNLFLASPLIIPCSIRVNKPGTSGPKHRWMSARSRRCFFTMASAIKRKTNTDGDNAAKKHAGPWSLGLKASMEDPNTRVDSDDMCVTIKDKYPKVGTSLAVTYLDC